jgi:hypothetical protein
MHILLIAQRGTFNSLNLLHDGNKKVKNSQEHENPLGISPRSSKENFVKIQAIFSQDVYG